MRKRHNLFVAWLPCALGVCLSLVSGAAAFAQSAQPKPASRQQDEGILVHHVPPMPRTPGEYEPITPEGRFTWFLRSTAGPKTLTGGLFAAGFGTAINHPREYGPHWEGFGKRYGMRLTGVSTGNAIQASVGALWGEDPRYFHDAGAPFGTRVKNIVDLTFRAYRTDGERHPAYARFIGTFGNNFLSNAWRAQSEADWQHALIRSGEGFGARAVSNAVSEFLPPLWKRIRPKPSTPPGP